MTVGMFDTEFPAAPRNASFLILPRLRSDEPAVLQAWDEFCSRLHEIQKDSDKSKRRDA